MDLERAACDCQTAASRLPIRCRRFGYGETKASVRVMSYVGA
jgi:hypothetical protein